MGKCSACILSVKPHTDWAETNKKTLLQGLLRWLSDVLGEESPCLPQTSGAGWAPALNPDCVVRSLLLNFPDHPRFHLLWYKGTMASCSDLKSLTCKHLCGDRTPSLSSSKTFTETLPHLKGTITASAEEPSPDAVCYLFYLSMNKWQSYSSTLEKRARAEGSSDNEWHL